MNHLDERKIMQDKVLESQHSAICASHSALDGLSDVFGPDPAMIRRESAQAMLQGEPNAFFFGDVPKEATCKVDCIGNVAFVPVTGVITTATKSRSPIASAPVISRTLKILELNVDVQRIVLVMDTPGGGVTAVGMITEAVESLKNAGKSVETYVSGLCCSGGIWIAVQTEKITSTRMGMIGSIGVISVLYDDSKWFEQIGVKIVPVASSEIKSTGYGELTQTQINAVRDRIGRLNEEFRSVVASGRNLSGAKLDAVANGDYWEAVEAQKLGLIDAIQSFEDYQAGILKRPGSQNNSTQTQSISNQGDFTMADHNQTMQNNPVPASATGITESKAYSFDEAKNLIMAKCAEVTSEFLLDAVGALMGGKSTIDQIESNWERKKLESALKAEKEENARLKEELEQKNSQSALGGNGSPGVKPVETSRTEPDHGSSLDDVQAASDREYAAMIAAGYEPGPDTMIIATERAAARFPSLINTTLVGHDDPNIGACQGKQWLNADGNTYTIKGNA